MLKNHINELFIYLISFILMILMALVVNISNGDVSFSKSDENNNYLTYYPKSLN